MSQPIIEISGLSKRYRLGRIGSTTLRESVERWWSKLHRNGDSATTASKDDEFWALKDISFCIEEGDVLGIIGRNGAGKSTLLKILSRITEPTAGSAVLRGRVGSLLEVGTGFHPELTGRENIYLNGAILGMKKREIDRKFDEIVAFSEVESFMETPVKRYSSGMYVRLAFAVAAHLDPEILIIDEVLAVGDAKFQKKCLGKMKSISKEGRTVLFVSHNLGAVISLCNKGIVLSEGKLDYFGPVTKAAAHYTAATTASGAGFVDFTGRTAERSGPQMYAVLKSLALLDKDRRHAEVLEMGQRAYFQVEIDFKRAGDNFEIGVGICNMHGIFLHYFVSPWEGFASVRTSGIHKIEVEVPAINLFPGTYQVLVWIKLQGGNFDDGIYEALQFDVQEAQITSHYAYFQRYTHNSQVYLPTSWRLVN